MSDKVSREIDLIYILKLIWGSRKSLCKWAIIGFVVGVIVAFSLPNQYKTQTTIALESKSASSSLMSMKAMTGLMGIDLDGVSSEGVGAKLYPEIVKSTPFLLEFAEIPVKYKGQNILLEEYILKKYKQPWWKALMRAPMQLVGWIAGMGKEKSDSLTYIDSLSIQQAFAGRLGGLLNVEENKVSGTYMMSVVMQDPHISVQIADSMFTKLQRYMTNYKTSKVWQNLNNNTKMLAEAKQKYYELDSEYAQAVDRNQQLISKSAQVRIDRLKNERDLAFSIYQQLATQVESNKIQLQEVTPIATIIEPPRLPLRPSFPKRSLIMIGMAFLGACLFTVKVVVKLVLANNDNQENR